MRISVQKWGNSLAVRIPKAIAAETDLVDGAVVDLKLVRGKVILAPVRIKKHRLDDLLSGVTNDNLHHEVETGRPVGNEV